MKRRFILLAENKSSDDLITIEHLLVYSTKNHREKLLFFIGTYIEWQHIIHYT